MARETITRVVSNLTGKEMSSESSAWEVVFSPPDGRSAKKKIDLTPNEVNEFLATMAIPAEEIKRRGRKPGSKNK